MDAELVVATTSDGVYLHGAIHHAASQPANDLAVDAIICVHGVASNFYASGVFAHLTSIFQRLGIHVLRVNTRGHDGLSSCQTVAGSQPGGAAYEVVDQCRLDLDAWLDFLVARQLERIALVGHSLGAIKAVYHEALQPHPATRCVVALSPPRLSHQCFLQGESSSLYFQTLDEAQRCVGDGRGAQLLSVRLPFPMHISASSYVDKYGPGERYNIVKLVDRLQRPALFTYGSEELVSGIAFAGVPEALQQSRRADQSLDVRIIDGADHLYRQRETTVGQQITQWLQSVPTRGT